MSKVQFECIYTRKECEHINTSGVGKMVECDQCPLKNKPRKSQIWAKRFKALFTTLLISALIFPLGSCKNQTESKYDAATLLSAIGARVDSVSFSDRVLSKIIELRLEHPYIVYSQAVWESGHFKSAIFLENNNMFGMKFPTNRPTTAIGINRGHAVYESWEMCLVDYAMFQSSYMRGLTREQYFERLSSYAEDENYVHNLRKMHGKWQKGK